MGLTSVIGFYSTGTYKVFRTDGGDYVSGHLVRPTAIDADVSTVDFTANTLRIVAHGLSTGFGPYYLTTSGSLPAPLSTLTPYWVIKVDADKIKLADSKIHAIATTAIDLTDAGSGTHHLSNYFLTDLSVQPGGGSGLKDVPEGQHTENIYTAWSLVELKGREPGYEPDVVEVDGELYRVQSVDFFGIISTHWKATLERMTTP